MAKSKRVATESIWTADKIAAIKKKYGVDKVYLCRKNGADALAYWGEEYLRVVKGSIAAPVNKKFDSVKNFIYEYRHIGMKYGHEKDGVQLYHIAFSTLAEAARFMCASQAARARDWKEA